MIQKLMFIMLLITTYITIRNYFEERQFRWVKLPINDKDERIHIKFFGWAWVNNEYWFCNGRS